MTMKTAKVTEKTFMDITKEAEAASNKLFIRQNCENDIDDLLARAEQAFKLRQYCLNEKQRDALRDYGQSLVKESVTKLGEINDSK